MTRLRDFRRLLVAAAVAGATVALSSSGALLVACRKDAPRADENSGGPGASSAALPDGEGSTPGLAVEDDVPDAGSDSTRFEPRVESRRDGGALDAACEGASLSMLAAVVDPRCAVTEREWSDIARAFDEDASVDADGAKRQKGSATSTKRSLRQEARRVGDEIVVSIVNRGRAPLVVPLRYHPGHPELAFSILAEPAGRGVFELAPPKNDAPEAEIAKGATRGRHPRGPSVLADLDAGSTSFARVHSARIRLPPGGGASARLVVDPRIAKRLDRTCPDAGATGSPGNGSASECLPERLPKGRAVLHVGQLVSGIDAGEPARVEWDVP